MKTARNTKSRLHSLKIAVIGLAAASIASGCTPFRNPPIGRLPLLGQHGELVAKRESDKAPTDMSALFYPDSIKFRIFAY